MISNYYQPLSSRFFRLQSSSLPPSLECHSFLSFEDALWQLLKVKKLPPQSRLAIPDFYCRDVLENIIKHGYRYVVYPLDGNLQPRWDQLIRLIRTQHPEVVILFHAAGITNSVINNHNRFSWLLSQPTLVIEDAVHRLVDPSSLSIKKSNHVVIDSLRKVSPLMGSRLFSQKGSLSEDICHSHRIGWYNAKALLFYSLFRFLFEIGMRLSHPRLVYFAHQVVLKIHDNLIGDSIVSFTSLVPVAPLASHINYESIRRNKQDLANEYQQLSQLFIQKHPEWYIPPMSEKDCAELHVFPLILSKPPDPKLEQFLAKNQIPVWFKFPYAPWSKNRAVLFLPLGFHINRIDIERIFSVLENYYAQSDSR